MTHRAIKFFPGSLVVVLLLVVSSLGQTKNENSRYLFRVNIAEQPDCPIRVVLDSIRNSSSPVTPVSTDDLYIKPPENVMLRLENISKLSVAAYALASKGNGFHNVQVNVFLKPFRAGDRLLRGFGTGGSEQIEYSLDYVLFSDGTSWGPDRFGRSRQIALYFEGRNAALDQLRKIVVFTPGPKTSLSKSLPWAVIFRMMQPATRTQIRSKGSTATLGLTSSICYETAPKGKKNQRK